MIRMPSSSLFDTRVEQSSTTSRSGEFIRRSCVEILAPLASGGAIEGPPDTTKHHGSIVPRGIRGPQFCNFILRV